MKFASVKPDELAVVKDDVFVLIGDALAREGVLPKGATMIDLMTHFNRVEGALAKAMSQGKTVKLDPKQLKTPVESPRRSGQRLAITKGVAQTSGHPRVEGLRRILNPSTSSKRFFSNPLHRSSAQNRPSSFQGMPKPSFQSSS